MLNITESIKIPDREVTQRFVRAAGARGQNLNRDATAVELRFDIRRSSLPVDVQERLIRIAGKHVTSTGVLMVVSRTSRAQAQNRETAHERLLALLKRAARPARVRQMTTAPAELREDRLASKHRRSDLKRRRASAR